MIRPILHALHITAAPETPRIRISKPHFLSRASSESVHPQTAALLDFRSNRSYRGDRPCLRAREDFSVLSPTRETSFLTRLHHRILSSSFIANLNTQDEDQQFG